MSGTVLGKSCLVLGVEFGMWNARAVPGAVSWDRDGAWREPGMATVPGGIKPGEAQPPKKPAQLPGEAQPQKNQPSSLGVPQQLELLPEWMPGVALGAALPLPSPGAPWTHQDPQGPLLEHSARGGAGSTAQAPLWPSGCPALTSLLTGTGVFQNTDTSQGEVSTLTQGFVGKGRIWKLFTPQWVIQT